MISLEENVLPFPKVENGAFDHKNVHRLLLFSFPIDIYLHINIPIIEKELYLFLRDVGVLARKKVGRKS